MDTNSFLTISQLSNELQSGEAIIKFLVKRFEKWIPGTNHLGQRLYNQNSLITLIFLLDKINKGMLPSLIEKEFENRSIQAETSDKNPFVQKNIDLQERAVRALEKQATTEEEKIEAMNNIARAIIQLKTSSLDSLVNKEKKAIDKIDDLSQLLDTDEPETKQTKPMINHEIDDLSALIDDKTKVSNNAELDDLAALLDNESPNNIEIDDLSALIQNKGSNKEPKDNIIDDLSILVQDQESNITAIDDLSALINKNSGSKLIIQKPELSPKDDFEQYKSEIINIIIDLKNQGSTEKETCEQFNQEGILTFSGKTDWSVKTISQIYQLIDNAA